MGALESRISDAEMKRIKNGVNRVYALRHLKAGDQDADSREFALGWRTRTAGTSRSEPAAPVMARERARALADME
jgi:hypothetical protein